jgi:hypothetical protein
MPDWAKEAAHWRCLAHMLAMALNAIGRDPALPCRCGEDPYTDGDPCPKCFAAWQAEQHRASRNSRPNPETDREPRQE